MAGKVTVYIKQIDGPKVPVAVRINWLPNGAISPLMYWTPDGTCCKITSQTDCIPLAFLKDRGDGLRFKVASEIIETPEPFSALLGDRCETYLYLADSRFCQKNIIDDRYGHTGKEYVEVTLDVFPNGSYELIGFRRGGSRYAVEKTVAIEPRGAYNAGGMGLWHKVEARLVNENGYEDPYPHESFIRLAALYLELNKWFVSVANTGRPP